MPLSLGRSVVVFLIGALIGGVVSFFVTSVMENAQYQATATLVVRPLTTQAPNSSASSNAYDSFLTDQSMAETAANLATRNSVASVVAADGQRSVGQVAGSVSVHVIPRTPLLEVRVTESDGAGAAALANSYARTVVSQAKSQNWLTGRQLVLLEPATVPGSAEGSKLILNVLAAAVVGGCAALGIFYLYSRFRREPEDSYSGAPFDSGSFNESL